MSTYPLNSNVPEPNHAGWWGIFMVLLRRLQNLVDDLKDRQEDVEANIQNIVVAVQELVDLMKCAARPVVIPGQIIAQLESLLLAIETLMKGTPATAGGMPANKPARRRRKADCNGDGGVAEFKITKRYDEGAADVSVDGSPDVYLPPKLAKLLEYLASPDLGPAAGESAPEAGPFVPFKSYESLADKMNLTSQNVSNLMARIRDAFEEAGISRFIIERRGKFARLRLRRQNGGTE